MLVHSSVTSSENISLILRCGFSDSSVVLFMNAFYHIPIVDTWKHSIREES